MSLPPTWPRQASVEVGLCRNCTHAREVAHPRGGQSFWRCGMWDSDKGFAKYPQLPVVKCSGFSESVTELLFVSKVLDGEESRRSEL